MEGGKPERRGGKSWRKEREERERKKCGVRNVPLGTKDEEHKKETEDHETRRQKEEARKREEEEEVKKKVEEEEARKREEEEARKQSEEEEARRKEEEEAKKREEDRAFLVEYIREVEERLLRKSEIRANNLAVAKDRPELNTAMLDSSLKKNTAFIKRLKNLTESQHDSLSRDLTSLNLSKYMSEVAGALTEARLKMSDLSTALHLCSLLHARYHDFAPTLLANWQKVLALKKDEKASNMSKLRVDLRFYAELVTAGIFTPKEGLPLLGNVLITLVGGDKEGHQNISVLTTFCRHCGEDYMGLLPRRIRLLAQQFQMSVPKSEFLPKERQKNVRQLLRDYYSSLTRHLIHDHKELQQVEHHNRRLLRTRGELTQERTQLAETLAAGLSKLLANAQQMAELLDEALPELPQDNSDDLGIGELGGGGVESGGGDSGSAGVEGMADGSMVLWEDEDTKAFYQCLPDLKALVPSILYSESEKSATPPSTAVEENPGEDLNDTLVEEELKALEEEEEEEEEMEEEEEEEEMEEGEEGGEEETVEDGITTTKKKKKRKVEIEEEEVLPPELPPDDEPEEDVNPAGVASAGGGTGLSSSSGVSGGGASAATQKLLLEGYLASLPNCISRDLVDSAAMEFCLRLNTKPSRKKLVRALFLVPRTRLDLLPFYSRLVASLQPLMPDVPTDLVSHLRQDFRYQVRKKDQINIESKIKVVRFIGELVKFSVFPRGEALQCLRSLLMDFNHHHIEMACNLLETCGRFLYRMPDSHHRTKIYLEQMMRKKTVRSFDPRYNTMIENAYFYVNPPDIGPDATRKERPPLHQYIRRLLYNDLSKSNTEKILRQMRKMQWDDQEISRYLIKCLTGVWQAKFYNIRCIANLVAGLISHHDWVGPAVVDGVMEDIRVGLEVNHPKFNQRRVAAVRYLGELYNYRVIESTIIFKVLYSFISFGVVFDPEVVTEYDPPEHLFRLRLVCSLLETCGQYFSSGSSKRRLDCFLTYFQHYYQFKRNLSEWGEGGQHFPWQMDHLVRDTVAAVRPKLHLHTSLQEARAAVDHLNSQIVAKAIEQVPSLRQYLQPDDGEEEGEEGLHTIKEEGGESVGGGGGVLDEVDLLVDEDEEEGSEEEGEDGEGELDWGEPHGDSLTPSQHSQPGRSPVEEVEGGLTGEADDECEDERDASGGDVSGLLESEDPDVNVSLKHVHCEEDDDFMSSLDRMMADSVLERSATVPKPGQLDISVPVHIKSAKKTYDQLLCEGEEENKPVVNFVFLTRQGNKQQYNSVEMPVDSELVLKLRSREEAERMEKEKVKRMTLEINERQEEEEAAETLQQAQRPTTMNFNRDRRPKYQHPKGAPDADLIFGPKKIR